CKCSLQSLFIDNDSNNFRQLEAIGKGSAEFRHNIFAVGHLLDVLWRDEAHSINVLEAGKDELLQIFCFIFRGDNLWQSLPSITRTLHQFYEIQALNSYLRPKVENMSCPQSVLHL